MNLSMFSLSKKAMFVPMLASALLLGACADKEAATNDAAPADTTVDAQAPVEQAATDVDTTATTDIDPATTDVAGTDTAQDGDLVDIEQQDMPTTDVATDGAVVETPDAVTTDDVGSSNGDTVLDGTEQEEHVSTN